MLIGALLLGTAVGSAMLATALALGGTLMQSIAAYVVVGSLATLASATLFSFVASTTEDDVDTVMRSSASAQASI